MERSFLHVVEGHVPTYGSGSATFKFCRIVTACPALTKTRTINEVGKLKRLPGSCCGSSPGIFASGSVHRGIIAVTRHNADVDHLMQAMPSPHGFPELPSGKTVPYKAFTSSADCIQSEFASVAQSSAKPVPSSGARLSSKPMPRPGMIVAELGAADEQLLASCVSVRIMNLT